MQFLIYEGCANFTSGAALGWWLEILRKVMLLDIFQK